MAKISNIAKSGFGKIGGVDAPSTWTNAYSTDFDGTDDIAASSANIPVDVMNRRTKTISLWFDSSDGSTSCLFDFGSNTMIIEIIGNNLYVRHTLTHSVSALKVHWSHRTKWLNTAAWVHLAFTVSTPGGNGTASVAKIYLDAVEVLSVTATVTQSDYSAARCSVGGAINYGTKPYENSIDEVSWWDDVALDATAITAIYNSGVPIDLSTNSGNYNNSSDLVHWWRMGDGDTYPTLQDSVGSLDLTMTNMEAGDIVSDVPS